MTNQLPRDAAAPTDVCECGHAESSHACTDPEFYLELVCQLCPCDGYEEVIQTTIPSDTEVSKPVDLEAVIDLARELNSGTSLDSVRYFLRSCVAEIRELREKEANWRHVAEMRPPDPEAQGVLNKNLKDLLA